ncbi:hypothetical protein DS884_10825 [Tenacibaculum sp. E3R01]|uniref:hypothetical protein n=1 Tax=Tenacibaculum sp. E3R01 TaxID=2267227 RepID=UPI000DE83965|nr:hypothetical protein [Tenacibaculum sp. E3R01]RBW57541.1 hypothetical protein DS884_10825 [Tenacibaculum sp. E3R01]
MKKNKLKKTIVYIVVFLSLFVLFDLYILRGLFSSYFVFKKKIAPQKTEFVIKKKENRLFNFKIKNNSIIPDYFLFFRSNEIFLKDVNKIVFMGIGSRVLNTKKDLEKISLSFGCSNGLGLCSINPYEKLEKDYSYTEIIKEISHIRNISDNENNDLLYGEKLFLDEEKLIINNDSRITKKDSLEIEFYFGLFSLASKEQYPIKSNILKVGYLDLIESYVEKN